MVDFSQPKCSGRLKSTLPANASILIASGEDVVTVSGRLGHSDKI